MPANDPTYQHRYKQKHYADNKQRYIAQAAARRAKLKAEVNELKRCPCMDCGGTFNPWQMDFDHRPDEIKVAEIPKLILRSNRQLLMDEIAKCDVVCANCHRDRTYYRLLCDKTARSHIIEGTIRINGLMV